MESRASIARAVELACLLEASAEKPGNVSPRRPSPTMSYSDFVASARAIAPVMGAVGSSRVGRTILAAIQATRAVARANTNLGIVLLLAPLARAASREGGPTGVAATESAGIDDLRHGTGAGGIDELRHAIGSGADRGVPPSGGAQPQGAVIGRAEAMGLRSEVRRVLLDLDVEDARLAFEGIRLAQPGGLGRVEIQDVTEEPTVTLLEAMRLAADRDRVAREYVTDYEVTFGVSLDFLDGAARRREDLRDAATGLFLELLSRFPDSLIARKHGPAAASLASRQATDALAAGPADSPARTRAVRGFDGWLRDPSRRWSPGTTADLVAAGFFAWLLCGGEEASSQAVRSLEGMAAAERAGA